MIRHLLIIYSSMTSFKSQTGCEHSINGGSGSSEVRGIYLYYGKLNPGWSSSRE